MAKRQIFHLSPCLLSPGRPRTWRLALLKNRENIFRVFPAVIMYNGYRKVTILHPSAWGYIAKTVKIRDIGLRYFTISICLIFIFIFR